MIGSDLSVEQLHTLADHQRGEIERLEKELAEARAMLRREVLYQQYEDTIAENARHVASLTALRAALEDARHNGLIYWEPQTERGRIAKAAMFDRIDAALSATPPDAVKVQAVVEAAKDVKKQLMGCEPDSRDRVDKTELALAALCNAVTDLTGEDTHNERS